MRFFHYSRRTQDAYWQWIVRHPRFHKRPAATRPSPGAGAPPAPAPAGGGLWRHPRELGSAEVAAYLTHPAAVGRVAASTQNQALNALVFFCSEVLHQPLGNLLDFARTQRPARLTEVLSRAEVRRAMALGSG